jgi:transposase
MNETKLRNYADFSGKDIFVGMDVHGKSWSISLYFDKMYIRTITQPPSVDILTKFLKKEYPGANYICGYESGFCGFWIQRALSQQGISCKVIRIFIIHDN